MKKYLLVFGLVFLLSPFLAAAQNADTAAANGVTLEDLEVTNPGVLPTSPFYFFKEWQRGFQRFFTFNPVSRAEFELKIANEKAAELREVSEKEPQNVEALKGALANYKENAERLKFRLEALQETSANPNVNELLNKLVDRVIKHEQLFEELKAKHEAVRDRIEAAQEDLEEAAADAAERLDTAEKLKERLKKTVEKQRERDARELWAVGVLDKLEEKIKDDEVKIKLSEVKDDLVKDFDEKVRERLISPSAVDEILQNLPITEAHRLRILEQMKERTEKAEVKIRLENVEVKIRAEAKEGAKDGKEETERMTKAASELIGNLRERINSGKYGSIPESVKSLLSRAENHMVNAKAAFEKEDYGEAFGQANSAASAAKSAISQLLHANVTPSGIVKKCGVNTFAVSNECASGGFGDLYFQCYDGYEEKPANACRSSEDWQEYARKVCVNRCNISNSIPAAKPAPAPLKPPVTITPIEPNIVCTKEYNPVCDVNGRTYGNECEARVAGVTIKAKGECPTSGTRTETKPAPTTTTTNLLPKTIIPELKVEMPSVTVVPTVRKWSVAVKNSAFFPAELKIKKGDTVVWTNFDSSPAWPASAFHPTHQVYPGFDALKRINTGESYSFTFDKAGSWKYHDHLNPTSAGVVEVAE